MAEMLTVPESFALLQTTPDGRRSANATRFDLGLAGAVLSDLALRNAVTLHVDRVVLASGAPTGNQVLDTALGSIAAAPQHPAEWWVRHLGNGSLREAVLAGLVQRGTLAEERRRTLLLFTTTRHPERDGGPEALVRSAVADVLAGHAAPSAYTATLIGLLDATNTLVAQFGPVDREHVRAVVTGDWASPAVRSVLAQIQQVAVGAATSAAMTSVIVSTNS